MFLIFDGVNRTILLNYSLLITRTELSCPKLSYYAPKLVPDFPKMGTRDPQKFSESTNRTMSANQRGGLMELAMWVNELVHQRKMLEGMRKMKVGSREIEVKAYLSGRLKGRNRERGVGPIQNNSRGLKKGPN